MAYWLLKTEPETFSWEMQVKRGAKGEPWSGVRNFSARDKLRAMKKGDLALFYHTGTEKAVVGVVKVSKEAYPDTTADEPFWSMVDVEAVAPFPTPVTLAQVKAEPKLAQMSLTKYARLSVQPVTDAEWKLVCKMGGYKG